jgi:hypothetical protein
VKFSGRPSQTCRTLRQSADDRDYAGPSRSTGARTIPPAAAHKRKNPKDQFVSALTVVAEVKQNSADLLICHKPLVHFLQAFRDFDFVRVVVVDQAPLYSFVYRSPDKNQEMLDIGFGFVLFGQFGEPTLDELHDLRIAEIRRWNTTHLLTKNLEIHFVDSYRIPLPICPAIGLDPGEKVGEARVFVWTNRRGGGLEMGMKEISYPLSELALPGLHPDGARAEYNALIMRLLRAVRELPACGKSTVKL